MSFLQYWGLVIFWMICIFSFSTDHFSSHQTAGFLGPVLRSIAPHISDSALKIINGVIRKAGHVTEYALLSYLVLRALRQTDAVGWTRRWALISLLWVAAYALTDEWHQSFTAEREASAIDWGWDVIGGILMQVYLVAYHKIRRRESGSRQAP